MAIQDFIGYGNGYGGSPDQPNLGPYRAGPYGSPARPKGIPKKIEEPQAGSAYPLGNISAFAPARVYGPPAPIQNEVAPQKNIPTEMIDYPTRIEPYNTPTEMIDHPTTIDRSPVHDQETANILARANAGALDHAPIMDLHKQTLKALLEMRNGKDSERAIQNAGNVPVSETVSHLASNRQYGQDLSGIRDAQATMSQGVAQDQLNTDPNARLNPVYNAEAVRQAAGLNGVGAMPMVRGSFDPMEQRAAEQGGYANIAEYRARSGDRQAALDQTSVNQAQANLEAARAAGVSPDQQAAIDLDRQQRQETRDFAATNRPSNGMDRLNRENFTPEQWVQRAQLERAAAGNVTDADRLKAQSALSPKERVAAVASERAARAEEGKNMRQERAIEARAAAGDKTAQYQMGNLELKRQAMEADKAFHEQANEVRTEEGANRLLQAVEHDYGTQIASADRAHLAAKSMALTDAIRKSIDDDYIKTKNELESRFNSRRNDLKDRLAKNVKSAPVTAQASPVATESVKQKTNEQWSSEGDTPRTRPQNWKWSGTSWQHV